MPEESTSEATRARNRVVGVFVAQGIAGFFLLAAFTTLYRDQPGETMASLGASGPFLVATFFFSAAFLQSLRFELTKEISVSLELTAYTSMVPLLGTVLSAWIAVSAAIIARYLAIRQIGPSKIEMTDPKLQYARMFALFGILGVPVLLASELYSATGGLVPVVDLSWTSAGRVMGCGLIIIVSNNLIMVPVEVIGFHYSLSKSIRLFLLDSSIYVLTLPYAAVMAFSWSAMGPVAVGTFSALLVLAYAIVREMANTQQENRQAILRLESILSIGNKISLTTTSDLVQKVLEECRKVIDATYFSIALLDEATNELVFELDEGGGVGGISRIPVGEGLNSWIILNNSPLLVGSIKEIRRRNLTPVQSGIYSESWLGVPIVAHDRPIGVISVQSFRRNAFNQADLLVLTVVANQVGVALDNARLYENLENLTYVLEARVRQRTNELSSANFRLMAADRSKDQFLANMTHELRTPLNAIIGFSSVLLENTKDVLDERLQRFTENVHTGGENLLQLINDILDLAKVRAGKVEVNPTHCNVAEIIDEVILELDDARTAFNVRLIPEVEDPTSTVEFDRRRLKQVLSALISNAIRFSPPESTVVIHVAVAADVVPPGHHPVRIEVVDLGIGIEPDKIERIFDAFYQEGGGARKGGAGLGLALCRSFVELHGGHIEVRSAPGKGSTFTVVL